jgi:hypothetical protein
MQLANIFCPNCPPYAFEENEKKAIANFLIQKCFKNFDGNLNVF